MVKETENIWSQFWLDDTIFEDGLSLDHNTLQLASGRRAISNFVNILTGEDIPVYFWDGNKTGATDGKVVYLSANIVKKEDFDPAVGLALHEGSHIVLTDFDLIKTLGLRISELYKIGKEVGIDREQVKSFVYLMTNYVEDRYIDNYIFTTAPGYRPYYVALYEKYFNNSVIGDKLQSNLMRYPNLPSYEARIINLTNPKTDLDALPGLRQIAEEISLENIDRLTHTKDRIRVAVKISKIVFENIKQCIDEKIQSEMGGDKSKEQEKSEDNDKQEIYFDIKLDNSDAELDSNHEDNTPIKKEKSENHEDIDNGKTPSDVGGGNKQNDRLKSDPNENKKELQAIKHIIDVQKKFIESHENVDKKSVSGKQKSLLDIIEKSGIVLVNVGSDLIPQSIPQSSLITEENKAVGIECIVVKKLTKELLFSGMFPMSSNKNGLVPLKNDIEPPDNVKNSVIKGIQLGTLLGKKLKIRQETNTTVFPRRSSGKIFKRHLAEIGCGNESIFYKTIVNKYDKLNLHISIDASSSMAEKGKWEKTMTMVVAICKAASMIDNLRVSVSFRTTTNNCQNSINSLLPYVVCAYDSDKDKFSKIKSIFPYLIPNGATPEGLAFEATMDELVCKKAGELYYFLTISDGEPAFSYFDRNGKSISYNTTIGAEHTRKQYKKIQSSGVKGIAYFVGETSKIQPSVLTAQEKCFRLMYGNDAKFIDVNNVTSIAKTMNDLFLESC